MRCQLEVKKKLKEKWSQIEQQCELLELKRGEDKQEREQHAAQLVIQESEQKAGGKDNRCRNDQLDRMIEVSIRSNK